MNTVRRPSCANASTVAIAATIAMLRGHAVGSSSTKGRFQESHPTAPAEARPIAAAATQEPVTPNPSAKVKRPTARPSDEATNTRKMCVVYQTLDESPRQCASRSTRGSARAFEDDSLVQPAALHLRCRCLA